jgi:hypothetical protein
LQSKIDRVVRLIPLSSSQPTAVGMKQLVMALFMPGRRATHAAHPPSSTGCHLMTRPYRILTIILCLGLHGMPARSQPHDMTMHDQGKDQGQTADQDMMAGMEKMTHDMNAVPMTGNLDHDFVAMMIPHHQGAIDMARIELRQGTDPSLRRLAADIVAAQNKEIAMMKRWQATHPGR